MNVLTVNETLPVDPRHHGKKVLKLVPLGGPDKLPSSHRVGQSESSDRKRLHSEKVTIQRMRRISTKVENGNGDV
jgi:hypothetical protein